LKITQEFGTPVAPVVGVTVELSAEEAQTFVAEAAQIKSAVANATHTVNLADQLRVALAASKAGVLPA
jgi:hypothetical protein